MVLLRRKKKRVEADISNAEELAIHRQHAAKAREYYNDMTIRCKEQWDKIQQLSQESLPSAVSEMNRLKHSFTLTVSADYQMSKLVPHWGYSPQPGGSTICRNSNDLFRIVDHKHMFTYSTKKLVQRTVINPFPISLIS